MLAKPIPLAATWFSESNPETAIDRKLSIAVMWKSGVGVGFGTMKSLDLDRHWRVTSYLRSSHSALRGRRRQQTTDSSSRSG